MVKTTKLYDILGVSPSASDDEIKRSFRKLAVKYHPDKIGHITDEKLKAEYSEKFKEISKANEILSDPQSRKKYDKFGENVPNSHEGMNPFEMFARQERQAKRIPPIGVPIKISLENVYHCKKQKITYNRKKWCSCCNGLGGENVTICNKCQGKGAIIQMVQLAPGFVTQTQGPCHKCKGKGKCADKICAKCNGDCIIDETVEEIIPLEKGIKNGDKIIIHNKGHHPEKKSEAGDVVVIVEIEPHNSYQQKGNNLIYEQSIDLVDALCGGQIILHHLGGHQIIVKLDQIIHPGQLYYLHGEGLAAKSGNDKGDLIINFKIIFPKSLDENTKHAISKALSKSTPKSTKTSDNCYESTLQIYRGTLDVESENDDNHQHHHQQEMPQGMQCQQQ